MMAAAEDWIRSMLEALDYPFPFHLGNAAARARLISWIEDRKIRLWEIDQRAALRTAGKPWDGAFRAYLAALKCPYAWPAQEAHCVGFVVSSAVECDYDDDEENFLRDAAAFVASQHQASSAAAVLELGNRLGLAERDPEEILLRAAALAAATRPDVKQNQPASRRRRRGGDEKEGEEFAAGGGGALFEDLPLGFRSGDAAVDDAAKKLRLLYVSDLRALQDEINKILVLAQNFVADPKTNTTLGKVGR